MKCIIFLIIEILLSPSVFTFYVKVKWGLAARRCNLCQNEVVIDAY